jgi:hypothetical protein
MSQFALMVLLAAITWQDLPKARVESNLPNQRIQELQNRHDRRFRSEWYPRRSSGGRAK